MGLLTGDIANTVYRSFKGKLLSGIIRQLSIPESGGLDGNGDPIDAAPIDTACEGFDDNYSEYFERRFEIPDGDVVIGIFAKSIPGVTLSKDDRVRFDRPEGSEWYQLRKTKIDPARALWQCQAYPIPDPGLD